MKRALVGLAIALSACGTGNASTEAASVHESEVHESEAREPTADDRVASPTAPTIAATTIGHPPREHRAVAVACTSPAGGGLGGGEPSTDGACRSDGDCTAGRNGRCDRLPVFGAGRPGVPDPDPWPTACSYDACLADADCGDSDVCLCRDSRAGRNTCLRSECRTDADCGSSLCSPTIGLALGDLFGGLVSDCGSREPTGFYCHTPRDECADDSDCSSDPSATQCGFDTTERRWRCWSGPVCSPVLMG